MTVSRRQFLRGDLSARAAPVRPPWAMAENAFTESCTRCDACRDVCPTKIIVRGASGFPEIDFSRGECTFCGDCATACGPGALRREPGAAWTVKASISAGCVAFKYVECRVCGDACKPQAIQFAPRTGSVAAPQLDTEACTGCGACYRACPVGAITMRDAESSSSPCEQLHS